MEMSIIMPTHNGERTISHCLNSILKQSVDASDYEVIVVDDFSTDGTEMILKELAQKYKNLKYFKNKRRGAPAARNLAIEQASGRYLGFVDQDMVLEPDWIAKMCDYYEANSNIAGISGKSFNGRPNNIFSTVAQDLANNHFVTSITLPTNNCSYKKEIILAVDGFSEEITKGNEDAELSCKIAEFGLSTLRNIPIYAKHYQVSTLIGFLRQAFFYGCTDYWCKTKHLDFFKIDSILGYFRFSMKRFIPNLFLLNLNTKNRFQLPHLSLRLIYIFAYGVGALVNILKNHTNKDIKSMRLGKSS